MLKRSILTILALTATVSLGLGASAGSRRFVSQSEGFSLATPVSLTKGTATESNGGQYFTRIYTGKLSPTAYVGVWVYHIANWSANSESIQLLATASSAMAASVHGHMVSSKPIWLGGYPGRDVVIDYHTKDGLAAIVRAHIYLVRPVAYLVMVGSQKGEMSGAECDNILESFKLLK